MESAELGVAEGPKKLEKFLRQQRFQRQFLQASVWHVPSERNKRMKEIDKQIRASLMGIIKNREKAMKAEEAGNDDLAY
ncbi:hypothetical protein WN943_014632 [Citrus x changshan-huyou]